MRITETKLSNRAKNALLDAGIETLDDLPSYDELKQIRNLGKMSLYQIEELKKEMEVIPDKVDLRDYFAGLAMQARLSNDPFELCYDEIAEWAYEIAEAMLTERKR
jgi:predicted nuclease with TOPRIM domain